MKVIITILALTLSFLSVAQEIPGFMGKKSKITYDFGFSPSLGEPDPFGESSIFRLNMTHSLSYERAYKKNRSWVVRYEMYKTHAFTSFNFMDEALYVDKFRDKEVFYLTEMRADSIMSINVQAVEFNLAKYSVGNAPFGVNFYWGPKFMYMKYNVESVTNYKKGIVEKDAPRILVDELIFEPEGVSRFQVGLVFGSEIHRSIGDLGYINLGARINVIPIWFYKYWFDGDEPSSSGNFKNEITKIGDKRILLHEIYSLKIGFGIFLP